MRPIQPPPGTTANRNRPRRRPDLTLPLPQRDPALAVPLPLPPACNSAPSTSHHSFQLNFSELERVNRIGSGSGGTVYKVLHRRTGRLYALKVISYGNYDDSVRLQICREIEILRDVDNLNVVKCHDMFDHNGEIQVLLEYMDGGSLEGRHIPHEPTLSDLARQILSGLYYLHRRKIVHRDIKPSNLLINSLQQVKIADFGVSRVLGQTMDPCNSSVGTIAYMSPERINTDLNHGMYDGYAGDIWSLGVSILEFYLGRFPFAVGRQGDWASLVVAICMAHPPEAPAVASREFRDFIARCLQREPGHRWTAAQLLRHPFIVQNNPNQNQECEELMAKGITGTGKGFDLPGRRLGGISHQPPLSLLCQNSLAAAENRARCGTLLPSGPKHIGGDSNIMAALSLIQAAAMAAERRLHDDLWCGSKTLESGTDLQGNVGSSVGPSERSKASTFSNDRSMQTSYLSMPYQEQ